MIPPLRIMKINVLQEATRTFSPQLRFMGCAVTAPLGHASAQRPQPIHFAESMWAIRSIEMAPVGQRSRQIPQDIHCSVSTMARKGEGMTSCSTSRIRFRRSCARSSMSFTRLFKAWISFFVLMKASGFIFERIPDVGLSPCMVFAHIEYFNSSEQGGSLPGWR